MKIVIESNSELKWIKIKNYRKRQVESKIKIKYFDWPGQSKSFFLKKQRWKTLFWTDCSYWKWNSNTVLLSTTVDLFDLEKNFKNQMSWSKFVNWPFIHNNWYLQKNTTLWSIKNECGVNHANTWDFKVRINTVKKFIFSTSEILVAVGLFYRRLYE